MKNVRKIAAWAKAAAMVLSVAACGKSPQEKAFDACIEKQPIQDFYGEPAQHLKARSELGNRFTYADDVPSKDGGTKGPQVFFDTASKKIYYDVPGIPSPLVILPNDTVQNDWLTFQPGMDPQLRSLRKAFSTCDNQ